MTGTSQATAFVTGAAVLVMSHKDLYNKAEEVKKFILATGDSSPSLIAKTKTSRQLNLFKSLTLLEQTGLTGLKNRVDSSVFSIKTNDSADPNAKQRNDVNQNVGFGLDNDLVKALGGLENRKRKNQLERLGNSKPAEEKNQN